MVISFFIFKFVKKNMLPKLLVIGHARHGKDTFAEILRDSFGFKFSSSSLAASEIFIYDALKEKYGYQSAEDCYEDRVNKRSEWYDLICQYNINDKALLAKEILKKADCYIGMRDVSEINECVKQKLFDLIIWVDASERLPLEPTNSFNIDKKCADIIIENNDDLESFVNRVIKLGNVICK